jgi:hypothetical protein
MHTFARARQDDGNYLYVVGYWCPPAYNEERGAKWQPMRDCASPSEAARWVCYLNGGERPAGDW